MNQEVKMKPSYLKIVFFWIEMELLLKIIQMKNGEKLKNLNF